MEPIERELTERQARLERLAFGLRKLEERRARRLPEDEGHAVAMDRELFQRRSQLGVVRIGIAELEEIIAEGRNPPRMSKPAPPTRESVTGRRQLSPEEQQVIADKARAALPPQLLALDIEITVEPLTAPDGSPHIHVTLPPMELNLGPPSEGPDVS